MGLTDVREGAVSPGAGQHVDCAQQAIQQWQEICIPGEGFTFQSGWRERFPTHQEMNWSEWDRSTILNRKRSFCFRNDADNSV